MRIEIDNMARDEKEFAKEIINKVNGKGYFDLNVQKLMKNYRKYSELYDLIDRVCKKNIIIYFEGRKDKPKATAFNLTYEVDYDYEMLRFYHSKTLYTYRHLIKDTLGG